MNRTLARLLIIGISWTGTVGGWIAVGPPTDPADEAEVAVVLGAAVLGDVPSPVFAARLDHAVDLYQQGRIERMVLTGGKSDEDRLSEAQAGALYVETKGIPATAILIEDQSRTTRQNLANAKRLLGAVFDERILVVSDPLHMRRAMAIAADLGLDARSSPTPYSRYRSMGTRLPFLAREIWFMHMHWLFGV